MTAKVVWAAVAVALAACGGGEGATEGETQPGDAPAAEPSSRFEVSVDTQRVTNPDSQVAPSENPDN